MEHGLQAGQEFGQGSLLARVIDSMVSQLRTPVASIEVAAWMLDAELPEEKQREFVGIVRRESHRLDQMLSAVLEFTKPRQPRFRKLDLAALVDEVIHLADPKDRGPAILFYKHIPADLPRLRGDREQIRQVLLNLVVNAIQASPGGGPVDISARIEGGRFVITVEDHGRGIPETARDRIFEPFFTTNATGLGLGLAVAQRFVAGHSGRITVDASSGKGTAISVSLPVDPARRE